MEELKNILNQIMIVANTVDDDEKKHLLLSSLWTEYYQKSDGYGIILDDAYRLSLLLENESYIVNQKPVMKRIDLSEVFSILEQMKSFSLSINQIETVLDYVVYQVRLQFQSLGIDIENHSLNGYCEIGQVLSIFPFEEIGLPVTKNRAEDAFSYSLYHSFGTVTFPSFDGEKTYLIDTTYRQFFTTVRCNEGRYYTTDENTGEQASPDVGYFVEDVSFAKSLMAKGYVELTKENAEKYGKAFELSSLKKGQTLKGQNKSYFTSILSTSTDYQIDLSEIESMKISLKEEKKQVL